jgi:hypothetical protein
MVAPDLRHPRRSQAEIPLIDLSEFGQPPLSARANATVQQMQRMPMRVSIVWVRTDAGWKIQSMSASPRVPVAAGFLTGH